MSRIAKFTPTGEFDPLRLFNFENDDDNESDDFKEQEELPTNQDEAPVMHAIHQTNLTSKVFIEEVDREGFYPGMKATDFSALSYQQGEFNTFKMSEHWNGVVILLFYPIDFGYISPTEILTLSTMLNGKPVKAAAISTGSLFSKAAWAATPPEEGGIQGVNIPLVADPNSHISRSYGMLRHKSGYTFRGIIIVAKMKIMYRTVSDLPIGIGISEALRVAAACVAEGLTPPNWHPGQPTLESDFAEEHARFSSGKKTRRARKVVKKESNDEESNNLTPTQKTMEKLKSEASKTKSKVYDEAKNLLVATNHHLKLMDLKEDQKQMTETEKESAEVKAEDIDDETITTEKSEDSKKEKTSIKEEENKSNSESSDKSKTTEKDDDDTVDLQECKCGLPYFHSKLYHEEVEKMKKINKKS